MLFKGFLKSCSVMVVVGFVDFLFFSSLFLFLGRVETSGVPVVVFSVKSNLVVFGFPFCLRESLSCICEVSEGKKRVRQERGGTRLLSSFLLPAFPPCVCSSFFLHTIYIDQSVRRCFCRR